MLILLTLLMLLQVFFEDNLKKIQEFLGLSVYSASMPVGRDLSDPAGGLDVAAHSVTWSWSDHRLGLWRYLCGTKVSPHSFLFT